MTAPLSTPNAIFDLIQERAILAVRMRKRTLRIWGRDCVQFTVHVQAGVEESECNEYIDRLNNILCRVIHRTSTDINIRRVRVCVSHAQTKFDSY